jgi:hypothetical protein
MPNPDPSGSSDTRPRNERLRSHREIAGRDFLLHDFLTIENSDSPIYDSTGSSDTRPRTMDGPDLIGKSRIAISICMSLLFPETPISRSPIFVRSLTPVPCERTAQILSGFSLGFPRAPVHGKVDSPMTSIPIPLRIS